MHAHLLHDHANLGHYQSLQEQVVNHEQRVCLQSTQSQTHDPLKPL